MKTELGRTSVAEGAAERPRAATGVEILPAASGEGLLRPLGLFFRDGFGGFLPQPPYFSGGPRRGFTFGLPAHRSFGQDRKSTRLNSQSPVHLVCRLLLEKKKKNKQKKHINIP